MGPSHGILLATLLVAGVSATATFDKALTSSARAGVQENKIFFTFQDISPPRRSSSASATKQSLLSLAFPGHSRFGIILDRAHGKVILESVVAGETQLKDIPSPEVKPRNRLSSLVLELDQEASLANVYLQCKLLGSVELPAAPREMNDDAQALRVYRLRHLDVSIDWDTDILELLEKVGCSNGEDTGSVQNQGNEVYTYRRGDIPVLHEEESSTMLVKSLKELIETIKELQIEIQTQREETALLRDALLNCEACKPGRGSLLGR